MPTYNMVNQAKLVAVPRTQQEVGEWGGRVRLFFDQYTMITNPAGDVLTGPTIPRGYRILPNSFIQVPATLGAATLAVGISGTPAKYGTARTLTATPFQQFFDVTANMGAALTADETLIITTAAAALPASGVLKIYVFATLD